MLFASGKELKDMLHGAGDAPFHWEASDEGRLNRDKGDAATRADKEGQLAHMWSRKKRENEMPTGGGAPPLGESVAKLGVMSKVNIVHKDDGFVLWDGHHRVQAAADAEEASGKPVWVNLTYGSAGGGQVGPKTKRKG